MKETPKKKYKGDALERGGTSINGGTTPEVRGMLCADKITRDMTVLDYGAGKYARNADFLRENGVHVYAYDPYNGNEMSGWKMGCVSSELPNCSFDFGFTSYVLNVVPEHVEDEIIDIMERLVTSQIVHITRNKDIFDFVKRSLYKKNKFVSEFFLEYFADSKMKWEYDRCSLHDDDILEYCYHGTKTSRGFQRIPILEPKGYRLYRGIGNLKMYDKSIS